MLIISSLMPVVVFFKQLFIGNILHIFISSSFKNKYLKCTCLYFDWIQDEGMCDVLAACPGYWIS